MEEEPRKILEESEEGKQKEGLWFRLVRGFVGLVLIIGMLYLSGFYQYFFYQRTPAAVEQIALESAVNAETLIVPLAIFVLESNGARGSERKEEDIIRLVNNASKVWEQASIILTVKTIKRLKMSDKEIKGFLQSPVPVDPKAINVFLAGHLDGINGIAFGSLKSVAIADRTTVYDFRALAHEIGHILGLSHIVSRSRLMHQGANGTKLSFEEIIKARRLAELLN